MVYVSGEGIFIFFLSTIKVGDTINSRKYGKPALLSQSVHETAGV
jgi:hypothetical protein